MKITAILLMFVLGACTHAPNLAARIVHDDSHVECTPFYTNAGSNHVHSCVVEGARPALYCIASTDMMGVTCGPALRVLQDKAPAAQPAPSVGTGSGSSTPPPSTPAPDATKAPAPPAAPAVEKKPAPHEAAKK